MHQYIRIPVDRVLMVAVGKEEMPGVLSVKRKERGSSGEGNECLTKEGIALAFASLALLCWCLAFFICLVSFILFLVAGGGDPKEINKKKIDTQCGDGLFWTVYLHLAVHTPSWIFISCVMTTMVSFDKEKAFGLKTKVPLPLLVIPVVFCLGYIIAFGHMAAQMEGRFQDALKNQMCMNAVSEFGHWGESNRLDVLRNMYLGVDILYCVCYFCFMCAACLMAVDSREW
jgi:hypothetical protein